MKKKIIFMIVSLNIGGTEKALLSMISEMPTDKYDITILMLEKHGGYLNSIPTGINIEYVKDYKKIKSLLDRTPKNVALNFLKSGKIIQSFNIILMRLLSKVLSDRVIYYNYLLKRYPKTKIEYDIAVAYAGPVDFISYFIMYKINSKKKVQWIHFDITKTGFDLDFSTKLYKRFDKIFVVSNEAKKKLIKLIPSSNERTEVFLNVVSRNKILIQSKNGKGFNDNFDGLRILTVGRLSNEKGQDLAIRVLTRLVEDGYKVKWYCLGEGPSRKEYEKLIKEDNIQNKFILLGSDPNPYPYIDQCDIYVQPSRHEGYCLTLAEAKCLNKPIVTTNFTGAEEQIINENTGLIVNINEFEIYNAVKKLIINRDLCMKLSKNLTEENFDSPIEMDKIYSII